MDLNILLWIQENLRCPALDTFFITMTRLGDIGIVWIALILILLCRRETRQAGIAVAVAFILSAVLTNLAVKPLFDRPRPFQSYPLDPLVPPPAGSSFPSAHSAVSFACAQAWFLSGKRRIRIVGFLLAACIAFSRLYVFVHYPTDVLAGTLLGLALGTLALPLCRWCTA